MKALSEKQDKEIMSVCKFLVSLLLLFCCRTTVELPWTSFPPSPSPSPSPGQIPAKPVLPQEEVDVVNALYGSIRKTLPHFSLTFTRTNCSDDSQYISDAINCTCSRTRCRVTKIDLSSQNLKVQIPAEIGVLSQMTYLDLSGNKLSGQIPSSLVKLMQLSYLDLSENRLSGQIPSSAFVNMTRLSYLDLSENKLSGPIPSSFVNLTQLSTLNLYDNNLEGPLPLFISEMKSLESLYLDNNFFNETIPHTLGLLQSLEFLSLSNNLLSGSIPIQLGNISSLRTLYLDDNLLKEKLPEQLGNLRKLEGMYLMNNEFSGALPSNFRSLRRMKYFNIKGNSISGTIPDFIADWIGLETLILSGNNFEGSLQTDISALKNLTKLEINNLSGSLGGSLFPQLSNARDLRYLTLRNCSLADRIPEYIWKLPSLYYLDLSFNSLTGGIPAHVEAPPRYIFLRSNKLNGSLPGWMLNATESFVDVSENVFSNTTISGTISSNKNLFECCSNISDMHKKWLQVNYQCPNQTRSKHLHINCGGNQTSINGTHYEADWDPDGKSTFNLSSSGGWASSSMGMFSPSAKQFMALKTCNVSSGDDLLYMTARISTISLKYYGFCLKDDDYTVRLYFEEVGLDAVAVRDSGIKRRRVFDVEIQGKKVLTDFNIEKEAEGVNKGITREFNISVNTSRLEIHLYSSGKGSSSSTRNAGPLISAISVFPVPKKHRKFSPGIIAAIVGPVLLFVLMILGLLWKLGWLGGKRPNGVELYPGGVFNFQQIKAATNNFAPDKKIGQGGFGAVYKGTLPNGTEIAVKQLSTKSKQGVGEFINEMGTIYALKHPNLVRLMGCCAEENQLLLVYEYMENNSLGHALFGADQGVKEKLNWKIRVKICLDVAKGLAYLHEECKLKLIHGDIKPTNILLDKDFNAKISDFGFARTDERGSTRRNARPDEGETPVNARVKGTPGYIAPECMKAKYSPKVDVYSFGILTLEIISGKQSSTPNSRGQTTYLLDLAYEYLRQGNPLALIDSRLRSEYNVKEAKQIIYLAMQCINHNPDQRPTMPEVVKILEGKKTIDNILVPIAAVDDLMMGKATVAFSQSIHSASTSSEGASDSKASVFTSKEIDDSSLSAYDSAQRPAS